MNGLCRKLNSEIVAYIDGQLPQETTSLFDRHIETCAECRSKAQELRTSMECLLKWEDIKPAENYDSVFWEKINVIKDKKKGKPGNVILHFFKPFNNHRFALATCAAACAVFITLSLFSIEKHDSPDYKNILFVQEMDLLSNMEVIENSEALEDFEIINCLDILEQELNG